MSDEALVVANELYVALYEEPRTREAAWEVYSLSSMREILAGRLIKVLDAYRAKRGG